MKNFKLIITVAMAFSLLLACSSVGKKEKTEQVKLRPLQEVTMPNGLRVLYIQDKTLPRVSYHLLVQSGSAQDPSGADGLSALTLSLLETGSAKKTALQIADDFAQLGSSFNETAGVDSVVMSTSGLSEYKDKLLGMFADVVLHPSFAAPEIERKRSQVIAQLMQLPDEPTEYASQLYDEELFGKHPYAHPVTGYVSTVKALTRDQIKNFYSKMYRPNNAMLAIVGNFDDGFKAQVEKTFAGWEKGPIENPSIPAPAPIEKMTYKLFTKPGLQQTQIRIGQLGIGRTDPDYMKLRLANIVLGGAFASRLNQKVRDDLGLTYSISSQFEAKKGTGSFEINTFARNEKSAEAIKSTMDVVREFQSKGITEQELKAAKALLVGQFPAAIETVDRLAFNLLALRVYGVPDTYLTNFFENVNSIQLKDVNEAIKKHFSPDKFKVVVFADEKSVSKELATVAPFEVQPANRP